MEVAHVLTLLQEFDRADWKGAVKKPIKDLHIAPYYGCLLTRPKEVSITKSVEKPSIMEEILEQTGCQTIYFPFKTECCASFQVVNERNLVKARTRKIIASAVKNGADMLVLSCPLCRFNLDAVQQDIAAEDPGFTTLPVLYFTQLLALLCGLDPDNRVSLKGPDGRSTAIRSGGDPSAVGRDPDIGHDLLPILQRIEELAIRERPELDRIVARARSQGPLVG